MALIIHRQSSLPMRKSGLSTLGKGALALLIVLLVVALSAFMLSQANQSKQTQAAIPLNEAVTFAMSVAQQQTALHGSATDRAALEKQIEALWKVDDPLDRADRAQELLTQTQTLVGDRQSSIDEINGALNRIRQAQRAFRSAAQ